MMKLEEIGKGSNLIGVEPNEVIRVVGVELMGHDALTLYYKTAEGGLRERMLFRSDEEKLSRAESGLPWAFDANGEDFKLAVEAQRITLANLFDPMMAVHTSNVEPLPHQITAVYESMLPRQPLRYVLADDPGAGKTIMAGLYIRELLMRADAQRVLIVAPGSLVEQWQDELLEKFGLGFSLFSREHVEQSRTGNPFDEIDLCVARVDQLSRSDELKDYLRSSHWDLIVVDEAHKLSAGYFGNKINKTKRFELGELLSTITRNFLLMTATPHNGKEESFQLFLSLLDADRFYGKFRESAQSVDISDLMRRMVKEDLLKFDGTRLFPDRRAYTVNYRLSEMEARLYEEVTQYVKNEFNKVDQLDDNSRKGTVGFALTSLQRRLASSPEAIYQSLRRRREKLKRRVEEEKLRQRGDIPVENGVDSYLAKGVGPENLWEADDSLTSDEYELFETAVVDQATAAQTIQELEAEIFLLEGLENAARQLVHSGTDRKWDELSNLLQNTPEMLDEAGRQRKLIVFTEQRDTLNYLSIKIRGLLGSEEAVVLIHGGVKREDRRIAQEAFRNDPKVRVMLATDAAGEGVNLQNGNLMVNYDLPWNPNRLEQRFGRIHRIGQTQICHLWNMVAAETREGEVFHKLFEKLEVERAALGGRVFDILGEVFEEKSLKDFLIEAIRYGSRADVQARSTEKFESLLDRAHLESILKRNALCEEVMNETRLFAVKAEMEKAEARKLQPYFIRSFFQKAYQQLGGDLRPREQGRYEITHVPARIRERDRLISGRHKRRQNPVLPRYERICFEKQGLRLTDRPHAPMASLVHPAHPLMQAILDLTLEAHRSKLKQGAVLVDPNDMGLDPRVIFLLEHSVKEGADPSRTASRRIQFVTIDAKGQTQGAGWAPHLDLQPLPSEDQKWVTELLSEPWLTKGLEEKALAYASNHLVPEHFNEVQQRREATVEKTLKAVHERLVKEIDFWSNRYIKHQDEVAAGKDARLNLENTRRTIDELTARREARVKELEAQRHVISATPVVMGGALVLPQGWLLQKQGSPGWHADAQARSRVEALAMQAVMRAEKTKGCSVIDVSAEKCGWDITSQPPAIEGKMPPSRHIEVKGRAKGQSTLTVTRNEILYGLNQKDKFLLAIVLVDGEAVEGPYYVANPFEKEPDWAVTSINLDLQQLLSRAVELTGLQ